MHARASLEEQQSFACALQKNTAPGSIVQVSSIVEESLSKSWHPTGLLQKTLQRFHVLYILHRYSSRLFPGDAKDMDHFPLRALVPFMAKTSHRQPDVNANQTSRPVRATCTMSELALSLSLSPSLSLSLADSGSSAAVHSRAGQPLLERLTNHHSS